MKGERSMNSNMEMIDYSDMDIHFSGGVLMTLLADAEIQTRIPVLLFGKELSVNERNLFLSMIRLIRPMHNPTNVSTLRKQASQYKNCEISIRSDIPFHEEDYVRLLRERMSTDYYRLMEDAYEVLNAFLKISDTDLRVAVADKIIRSIKEVISLDNAIPDEALFQVKPDGSSLTKAELVACTEINFYSFIIGVFYYACAMIPDNEVGADTIRAWIRSRSMCGKKALMREEIGGSITQDLDISFSMPVLQEEPEDVVPYAPILKEKQIETLLKYLEPLYESKCRVPTLMYRNKLTPLYDFYVPPVLRIRETDGTNEAGQFITKPTPAKLLAYASHLLIVGDGGMGKSMVMLDLLFQSIRNFPNTGVLPVFTELKEFQMSCNSLAHYLYKRTENWWDHSYRSFTVHLERYRTIIFLDGFDEMKSCYHKDFAALLQDFTMLYPKAQIIISSRLVGNVVSMLRFRSVSVEPFTCDQCIELIQKYDFRPDRPELKAAFIKALREENLYRRHRQIAENPLLCTMMLRIFSAEGRVPGSIVRFYEQGYQILSVEHDAMKVFERTLHTGLHPRDLKVILEEVCMYAYSEQNFTFTLDKMAYYLAFLTAYAQLGISPLKAEDLIDDLKDNLCLMMETEEGCYCFIGNRYFDNYFTAVYLSLHLEGHSEEAIRLFEQDRYKRDGDHVLDMLYELGRYTTQIHLFLPKLKQIFDRVDERWAAHKNAREANTDAYGRVKNTYWDCSEDQFCCLAYLQECYDTISYTAGTVLYEAANYPVSPLLNFILELNNFHGELSERDIRNPNDYFTEEVFYEYSDNSGDAPVVLTPQDLRFSENYASVRTDDEGIPYYDPAEDTYRIEEVGRSYIIILNQLNIEDHKCIIETMTAPSSPYFNEYMHLRSYYKTLAQQETKTEGNIFRRSSMPRTA